MVSDSVSKKIGSGKFFGFGFFQILSILGDVSVLKLLGFETFPFFRYVSDSESVAKKFDIEKKV